MRAYSFSRTFKFFALILSILMCFSLTSCYVAGGKTADFPRHLCKTQAEMKKSLPKDIIMPDISKTGFKKDDADFYTVNIPKHTTTGYSIEVEESTDSASIFRSVEMRGIKTSIKGAAPEGFSDKNYTAIIGETTVKIGDHDCKYAAYTDKVYTDAELSEQKGTSISNPKIPTDNLNIKYFYIYFEDKDIRYSMTYKDFSVGTINDEICDSCLKSSEKFFSSLKKT